MPKREKKKEQENEVDQQRERERKLDHRYKGATRAQNPLLRLGDVWSGYLQVAREDDDLSDEVALDQVASGRRPRPEASVPRKVARP